MESDSLQKERGWVRFRRALSTQYKILLGLIAVVGFVLAWTGWDGPKLLEKIAEVPWLDFFSSDWFRTILVIAGISVVVLVVRAWFRAIPVKDPTYVPPEVRPAEVVEEQLDNQANFTLTPSLGRLPNQSVQMMGDSRVFKELTALWVTVENRGPDAVFTAQVRGIHPVERAEDGLRSGPRRVDNVAWEHTTSPDQLIRWRKSSRLKLAQGSESEELFWFWTAESATWTDQGDKGWRHYGIGWRLKPLAARVEFDLEVLDVTHQDAETRRCYINFGDNNRIEDFGFLEPAVYPPDQYDYVLRQLGSAHQTNRDLDQIASEVIPHFGWNEHQWGLAIQSLIDQGLIKGFTQKSGDGAYLLGVPTEITWSGWERIRRLRDEEDPG